MPVLGKCGVVRKFLVEAEPCEPPPGQMHPELFDQFALAGHAIEITGQ